MAKLIVIPQTEKTYPARTFEIAALLRVSGFAYSHAIPGRRITLCFFDPEGAAGKVVRQHDGPGASVNSREFVDALNWAKSTVFSFRDTVGADR
jgi:hypothetical protein